MVCPGYTLGRSVDPARSVSEMQNDMMIPEGPSTRPLRFRYQSVSDVEIDDIIKLMERGESCVLFGPRGIGKQIIAAQVKRRLEDDPGTRCRFVRLRLEHQRILSSERLFQLIHEELQTQFPDADFAGFMSLNDLEETLRGILAAQPIHLVLQVSNVDLLPEAPARQLLKVFRNLTHIRSRDRLGQFSVLLTGAVELASLVHGVDSEFTVTDQYVIQGFSRDFFRSAFASHVAGSRLEFEADCFDAVHEVTGGNLLLSRILLDSLLDSRREEGRTESVVSCAELEQVVQSLERHPSAIYDVMRHPSGLLDGSVPTLCLLEYLIENRSIPLSMVSEVDPLHQTEAPTGLELMGIARRDVENGRLVWDSIMIRKFIEGIFTELMLGDAFACSNCWEKALFWYSKARQQHREWVGTASHRPRLAAATGTFKAHLLATLSEPAQASRDVLRVHLAVGARDLLGFDSVTFWARKRGADPSVIEWEQLAVPGNTGGNASSIWYEHLESSDAADETRIQSAAKRRAALLNGLPESCNWKTLLEPADATFAMVVGLLDHNGDFQEYLVLDNFLTDSPLTTLRRGLAESVLKGFDDAYRFTCRRERDRYEAMRERQVMRSIPDVFGVIGHGSDRDHGRQALRNMGERLRSIGYHRVMFSLIDHGRNRIQGVVDCRPEDEPDIAEMTDFLLNRNEMGEYYDVQPACVKEARTFIIKDATTDPLTDKATVRAADLRAIAVIPLKNAEDEVVGTMHIETADKSPVPPDEIRWLEEWFTPYLTKAIEVALRVEMLEDALQEAPDAVTVFDHADRLRFMNRAATELIPGKVGWQQDSELQPAHSIVPAEALDVVQQARLDTRVSRYVTQAFLRQNLSVLYAAPLKDWRDAVMGTVLRVHNMSPLGCLLDALRNLAACQDVAAVGTVLMQAFENLGHKWGRLYLLDRTTQRLIGQTQFGLQPGSLGEKQFRDHVVVLAAPGSPASTWLCLDRAQPLVFHSDPERKAGAKHTTNAGLEVMNVVDNLCPPFLEKTPGTQWIDLPLLAPDRKRRLGKISTECPEEFTGGDFEIIKILSEAASAALNAIGNREDREAAALEREQRKMLEAMGITCHLIGSRLAGIKNLPRRVQLAESEEQKSELIESWKERFATIQKTINDTKLLLNPIELEYQRVSLVQLLSNLLNDHLPAESFEITCDELEFRMELDPARIQEVIGELLENTKKACGATPPFVRIRIEHFMQHDVRMCRIDYTDNGPGIPLEKRERIFEACFTEWANEQPSGTGLGLWFVQTVVLAHRGTVKAIEPSGPRGACFQFELPRSGRQR